MDVDPDVVQPEDRAKLGMVNMLFSSLLMLGVLLSSRLLKLEMEWKVLTAALRCTLQLGVLGSVILVPIFSADSPILVMAYLAFMLLVAAREVSWSATRCKLDRPITARK